VTHVETIDRDSGEPPWMQLRDILRAAILSGELTGRLPSARTLGQRNDGMAVNTVSKALFALRDEGLIESRKGWGWTVVPPGRRGRPGAGGAPP
jgi:DNA-binding transcriptional regulator YhcF (GntR family)